MNCLNTNQKSSRCEWLRWAHVCLLGGGVIVLGGVNTAFADPPTVTALNPAGLQQGTTVEVALVGELGTRPVLIASDHPGLTVVLAEDAAKLTLTATSETVPGPCWIRLYNADGASDLIPLHVGVLPEAVEAEPNNHTRDAQPLETLPAVVNGTLHAGGEVDTFRVHLHAGETLVAAVDAQTSLASPMDAVLQILDTAGFVLEQNEDCYGNDPQLVFAAPAAGDFLIRMFAFPAAPDSTINFSGSNKHIYRLTLTTGPYVDHFLLNELAEPLPVGWNLPQELTGAVLPGRHWLRPTSAVELPVSAFPAAPATLLERNQRVRGQLPMGAVATCQLAASKDETLRMRVVAQELFSELDPVLTIRDTAGKVLQEVDDLPRDSRDLDLTWKAPAAGPFTLTIQDRFGHGGDRYFFELSVEPETPRVQLTVEGNHYALKRETPLEIPVNIERLAGFADVLNINVVGLPEGIKAEAVTSEASGDSSKRVTLKLESGTAAAFNGPIRIVSTSANDTARESTATAPTPVSHLRTTSIWLTVLPATENAETSGAK